ISHPDWETRDTSTVQGMGGGGAAVQPDLVEKIDKSLSRGAPSTGYGLTETHGIVTANAAKFFIEKPASCGRVVPVCDVKLVDDDGNDVAITPEARGQLCVRGPVVVKGYINRPDATADAIRDGWFNTGDVAMVDDDGFLYIVDRAKDMVLRGGENVYSAEVEAAIYQNEAVAEAAVFGVPDDRLGEEVGVAIHLHPSASLSAEALQEFLGERIAKHKVPRYVWILDEKLPQNANGKFLKRELKERLIPTL
ncbi:MAG: class I adenylate-forming enzyme family protein, partial [Ilumatobacteraceae bacterium]